MHTAGIVSLSTLFASLVACQPMVDKPYVEVVTEIVNVVKTIDVTTTVYVNAATAAPESPSSDKYGHRHIHNKPKYQKPPHQKSHQKSPHQKSPHQKPHQQPHQQPPHPPQQKPHQPKYPHPPPKPIAQPIAPPPVYTPAPAPVKIKPPPAAPKESVSKPTGGHGGPINVGEMTYYEPGLGSCGVTNSGQESVVALAIDMMNNPANPNLNPLCQKSITISYGGNQYEANVADTCYACATHDIDIPLSLFQKVAPHGDGRVADVEWWFNE